MESVRLHQGGSLSIFVFIVPETFQYNLLLVKGEEFFSIPPAICVSSLESTCVWIQVLQSKKPQAPAAALSVNGLFVPLSTYCCFS